MSPEGQNVRREPVEGPTSFANGRYAVKRFLGEGGKKRVYLAHDTLLDRDVAFALIKTEGLDDAARERITREAQAMGRLGDHPHIVTVYDIGVERFPLPLGEGEGEGGQPYLVLPLMPGGDVEGLIEKAENHQLALDLAIRIIDQLCQALEHAHAKGIIHRDVKPGNVWIATSPLPLGEGKGEGSAVGAQGAVPAGPLSPGGRVLSGAEGSERGGNEAIDAVGAQHAVPPSSAADMVRPEPVEGRADANVVVKLGDFGLAVAIDRSRLTQAGMMVGTVSYMPPEQALGGEITARSDLYSVGCMLYEMVTGRPPFVGDDQIAIIGQHLNTPPVSPSWHRPDLPRGLEALILRLLEKDLNKRPASAGEVRQALASIDLRPIDVGAVREPPSGGEGRPAVHGGGLSDNPLYRRTFVGREAELRQLQSAFDGAMSGQGALAMVVGEPGIGKTALVEQLATYVSLRGGRTLVGHCYEEGSLSLPYLAFVEAMRSYVLAREPDALKNDLGSGAADVARIVSEIRDRVQVELRPPGDAEDDRWRLLQSVSGFLRNAAQVQPLLIVLEDLHWADRGTLDLLVHIARNLSGARLLIVGTYRDVEVDRSHPLSGALAELSRIATFGRVRLRGLTADEVQRVLSNVLTQDVQWALAEAVHRQTEGNPLFVQEVIRYLAEEGLMAREEGRWRRTGDQPLSMAIPEGLRDVIGKRITRLSPECNAVLSVAAVIGREFRLDVLQDVAGIKEEGLFAAIEEASKGGVLEERQRTATLVYRFAHAFFRQTLYEETFTPRRIRTHQQVARAMERRYAGRLDEHAVELAEHFAQSTDPEDLAKAIEYGELAAQRAMSVYAYGEAARHLDQALNAQEVLDPDEGARRCELLLLLGQALIPAGEPKRVADEVAEKAFVVAEAATDADRACRASMLALDALTAFGAATITSTRDYRLWADRLDRLAAPGTIARVRADLALAPNGRVDAAGSALRTGALALARQLDDPATLFTAALRIIDNAQVPPENYAERLRLAQEFTASGRFDPRVPLYIQIAILKASGDMHLMYGKRDEAEALWNAATELSERTRNPRGLLYSINIEAVRATLAGRLEDALAAADRLTSRSDELGSPVVGRTFARIASSYPLMILGRGEEALAGLPLGRQLAGAEGDTPVVEAWSSAILASLGRSGEALRVLAAEMALWGFGRGVEAASDGQLEAPTTPLALHLVASIALGEGEAASVLAERCVVLADLASFHYSMPVAPARLLGAAAALVGKRGEAQHYYRQALEVSQRIRNRPEIALTRLQLAELLLDESAKPSPFGRGKGEGDDPDTLHKEALDHLDFAIQEFRDMKMQPSLERALRHRRLLKA